MPWPPRSEGPWPGSGRRIRDCPTAPRPFTRDQRRPAVTPACAGISDEGAAVRPALGVREPCLQCPCPFPVPSHTLPPSRPRARCSWREGHGMRPCAQTGRAAGRDAHTGPTGLPMEERVPRTPEHPAQPRVLIPDVGGALSASAPQHAGTTCRHCFRLPESCSGYWQAAGREAGLPDARARPRPSPGPCTQSGTHEGRNLARDMHTVCPAGPRGTPAAHSAPTRPQIHGLAGQKDRTRRRQEVWVGWGKAPTESQGLLTQNGKRGV